MENIPSDNELMVAYAKGDENAFVVLFEKYSSKLNTFLRFRLGVKKNHLLEEIYQKTWLKLHSARKSFDQTKNFSTWFYTIALNTLRDEVSSLRERSHHQDVTEQIPDQGPTSEERYIAKEYFHRIEKLFTYLNENQKTALLLSDQEELSSKDIADIMRITDASVRQLVSRARKIIRSHLMDEEKA